MKKIIAGTTAALLLFVSQAFAGGYGQSYGWYGHKWDIPVSVDELADPLSLNAEQITILTDLESAHSMMSDVVVNVRANSLDADGNFNRREFKSQMRQNNDVLSEYKELMGTFKSALSEEQLDTWKNMITEQKGSCQDKDTY